MQKKEKAMIRCLLKDDISKNILLIKLVVCFQAVSAGVLPIMNFVWKSGGLNFEQVLVLQGIFAFTVFILELPSGMLADVWGYKKTIIMATIFYCLGYGFYCISNGFCGFAIAEIVIGFGLCLESGCEEALIFESLKDQGKEKEYETIFGKIKSCRFLISALSCIISSLLLIVLPPKGVVIVIFSFQLIRVAISFFLVEPKTREKMPASIKKFFKVFHWCLIKNKYLSWVLFVSAFFLMVNNLGFWVQQPYFIKNCGLPILFIGFIYAFGQLTASFGSKMAYKMNMSFNGKLKVIILLIFLGHMLMGMIIGKISFIFFLIVEIAYGFMPVVFSSEINKIAGSKSRATILSVSSLVQRCLAGIFFMKIGVIADIYGIPNLFLLIGGIVILGSVFFLSIRKCMQG